ncbi:MAG: hypothetical protein JO362_09485 [Streptomycetaceae bacterium]|nr:hypothetical protein [Streptomycetaceae bacterium]
MSHRTSPLSTTTASATDEGSSTLRSLNRDGALLSEDPRTCDQVAVWSAEHPRFAGAQISALYRRGACRHPYSRSSPRSSGMPSLLPAPASSLPGAAG